MHSDVQFEKAVNAAMGQTNKFGAMVRHYTNLVDLAEKGASPSKEVTEGLKVSLAEARRDYAVALRVLGNVLDSSTAYDVREPVEGDEYFFEISARKTEAELEKWRLKAQKEGVVA